MAKDIADIIRQYEHASEHEPMNARNKEPRRKPDNDQKKIRREMARSASEEESMSDQYTPADVANLVRAASLAPTLEESLEIMAKVDEVKQSLYRKESGLDIHAMRIEDTLTPGRVHELHTTATDWIAGMKITADAKAASQEMVVQASQWFNQRANPEAIAYKDEFDEQVRNLGSRLASSYGEQADEAFEAFKAEATRLRTMAVRNGTIKEAADGTPDYNVNADRDDDGDVGGSGEAAKNIGELKSESGKHDVNPGYQQGYDSYRDEHGKPNPLPRGQYLDDHFPTSSNEWMRGRMDAGEQDQAEEDGFPARPGVHRAEAASGLPEVGQQGYPSETFSNLGQNGVLPPEATSSNRAPIYQEINSGSDVVADDTPTVDAGNNDSNSHRDAAFGDDHQSFPVKASRKEASMDAQCPTCAGHGRVAVRSGQAPKVAFSGLPQIDEIASPDDKPRQTEYPSDVAFPWMLDPKGQVQQSINQAEQQINERNQRSPLVQNKQMPNGQRQGAYTAANDDSGWIGDMGGRGNGYPGVQDGGNAPSTNLGQPDPVYGYGGDNGNEPKKPYGAQEANDRTNNPTQWDVGQPTQDDWGAQEIAPTQRTSAWMQAAQNDPEIRQAQAFLQERFAAFQAEQS